MPPDAAHAPVAAPGGPWRASIVIEWENLRWSAADRCWAMLAELARQVEACPAPAEGLAQDIEVIILHEATMASTESVERAARESMGRVPARALLRVLPTEGCDYYAQKNEGVRVARGDLVVFLDSDVIPEAGWLPTLLAAFDDPRVEVACGACWLATDGVVSKAMALSWFFPLRDTRTSLEASSSLFANNVAFRRATALRYPFPPLPGSSRGSCRLLARQLVRDGRGLFLHRGARVQHPAPHGWRHLARRALAHGRDDLLFARATEQGGAGASVGRTARLHRRAVARILKHRRRVALRALAVPAALVVAVAYYTLHGTGDLLTRLAPGWAGRHLRL